jgi:hypothetical protein
MNKMTRNWTRMRTFANPGILFQIETSYSSRLVILPDPEESILTLTLIWREPSYGQLVSSERDHWILGFAGT